MEPQWTNGTAMGQTPYSKEKGPELPEPYHFSTEGVVTAIGTARLRLD